MAHRDARPPRLAGISNRIESNQKEVALIPTGIRDKKMGIDENIEVLMEVPTPSLDPDGTLSFSVHR